ncbi:acyl-ACP--UDP-N-acetylglucosamine O-acyltransferase [bacterium]|nr:acyl-ACP--UDP-N-acetylglucosamine O-acyltransferase [bacterium]
MAKIHPTAIIDPKAELADSVSVGAFSIIRGDVKIAEDTVIHSHVLVDDGARIGRSCDIHHGAVIGSPPQDLKYAGEPTTLEIGDFTVIREYADLNRGTVSTNKTSVGAHCLLMAYSHVAHDCVVGDRVILANGVQLAGHVTLEDWVIIGGLTPVHQFCTVGQHSFIGGGFRVVQDVPPYILAAGEPLAYNGLNAVGLKRRGFDKAEIRLLRQSYRIIYRSKLNTSQAFQRIRSELEITPVIENVMQFMDNSKRGIVR